MATNNAVNNSLSGQTGTGNFVGSTSPSLTSPIVTDAIYDTNGNKVLNFTPVANAVNYVDAQNSATTQAIGWRAAGSDSSIIWSLSGKGSGYVQIQGTKLGNNADVGFVGEEFSSVISSGSFVNFPTSSTAKDLTSISVTAGDYDVYGNILFLPTSGNLTAYQVWISTTSATAPDSSLLNGISGVSAAFLGGNAPYFRLNVTTATTVYISGLATFAAGSAHAQGGIFARRRR